jgi:starvation-inducible DNA-binding protein
MFRGVGVGEIAGAPARAPREMLRELMEDNKHIAAAMRKAHKLADDQEDSGTAGLLETFIDEIERRIWFLFEASRQEGGNEA